MKKKLLISTLIIVSIFVASAFVWAFSPKRNLKPSEYNIGTTYELAMKDKKPFIMVFYADWCSSCIKLASKDKLIEEIYKDKYNMVMMNVDEQKYTPVFEDYRPSSIPMIYIVDPSIDNRVLINNALYGDLGRIRVELDRYLRIRARIK